MTTLTHLTKPVKKKEIKRKWYLVDCKGKILGRVATQIAILLQGKHKSNYVPYLDMGDYVVVINAKEIKTTGKKLDKKVYTNYSGYPGGLKKEILRYLKEKFPEKVIERAVRGMLPKNKFRKKRMGRMYVFSGSEHPYGNKFNKS